MSDSNSCPLEIKRLALGISVHPCIIITWAKVLYYSRMIEVLVKGIVPDVRAGPGPGGSATQIDIRPALTPQ